MGWGIILEGENTMTEKDEKAKKKEQYIKSRQTASATVQNIPGTGKPGHINYDPNPSRLKLQDLFDWDGNSWEDYWRLIAKKTLPACQNEDCQNKGDVDIVGAHVYKCDENDKPIKSKWYIAPLCKSCNSDDNTAPMKLKDTCILAEVDKK